MLKFVAGEKGLSEVEDLDAFKKHLKEEKRSPWQIPKICRETEHRECDSC